jgi:hypothetical protein
MNEKETVAKTRAQFLRDAFEGMKSRQSAMCIASPPPCPKEQARYLLYVTSQAFSKSEGMSPISGGSPSFAASFRYSTARRHARARTFFSVPVRA